MTHLEWQGQVLKIDLLQAQSPQKPRVLRMCLPKLSPCIPPLFLRYIDEWYPRIANNQTTL